MGGTQVIDRIILGSLAAGIWAWVLVSLLSPSPLLALSISIDASDIDGLSSYIEDVVEDCTVSGEVYIYGMPYGDITGSISC